MGEYFALTVVNMKKVHIRFDTELYPFHTITDNFVWFLQIEEEREYNQKVCRDGDTDFGLPHRIVPKHPISVNLSR